MPAPTIIRWDQRPTPNDSNNPGRFAHKLLAEGDSWFTLGGVPQCNLLRSMNDLPFDSVIVTLADPGDRIRDMADIGDNANLRKAMSKRFGYSWDVILLSGGGNDLIAYAKDLVQPRSDHVNSAPGDYVREERLDEVLQYIQRAYRKIAALRDAPNSACTGKPILTHTYDYTTPRNSPALIGPLKVSGPWLHPAFVAAGIPQPKWNAVSDYLLDALAAAILELQQGSDPIANFNVVDTRGALVRAALDDEDNSNDWLNEIHPNQGGYTKLAFPFTAQANLHLS
jgi:hypothetical protein